MKLVCVGSRFRGLFEANHGCLVVWFDGDWIRLDRALDLTKTIESILLLVLNPDGDGCHQTSEACGIAWI